MSKYQKFFDYAKQSLGEYPNTNQILSHLHKKYSEKKLSDLSELVSELDKFKKACDYFFMRCGLSCYKYACGNNKDAYKCQHQINQMKDERSVQEYSTMCNNALRNLSRYKTKSNKCEIFLRLFLEYEIIADKIHEITKNSNNTGGVRIPKNKKNTLKRKNEKNRKKTSKKNRST